MAQQVVVFRISRFIATTFEIFLNLHSYYFDLGSSFILFDTNYSN